MPLENRLLEVLKKLSWRDLIKININYDRLFGAKEYTPETEQTKGYEEQKKKELIMQLP